MTDQERRTVCPLDGSAWPTQTVNDAEVYVDHERNLEGSMRTCENSGRPVPEGASVLVKTDEPPSERDLPLETTFEDGALVIRIGIDTLVVSAEQGPLWPRVKVLDRERFGRELAREIERNEDESGLTALMRLIDQSVEQIVENASDCIAWSEDDIEDLLP